MLIAHLGHGEVYVPTIEKTFFERTLESKKNPVLAPGFFSCARADTRDRSAARGLARRERCLNST
jgi:hypothetical protein